ncbi:MAG: hypothetical protein OEY23_08680 [Acidimicrobiia bacterium]|nr:hypothetical protein [Acidimicrobiia bacterium]
MAASGWTECRVATIESTTWVGSDLDDALGFLERSLGLGAADAARRALLDRAAERLRPHETPSDVVLPAVALVSRAIRGRR